MIIVIIKNNHYDYGSYYDYRGMGEADCSGHLRSSASARQRWMVRFDKSRHGACDPSQGRTEQ